MKKILGSLVIFILIWQVNVYGQWSVGFHVDPGIAIPYNYDNLPVEDNLQVSLGDIFISYEIGSNLNYELNDKLEIAFGVSYLKFGYALNTKWYTLPATVTRIYDYFSFPLYIQYNFKKSEKYELGLMAGLAYNHNLRTINQYEDFVRDLTMKDIISVKNSIFSYSIGFSWLYSFSNNWHLQIMPDITYFPINDDAGIASYDPKSKVIQFSIGFGIRHSL